MKKQVSKKQIVKPNKNKISRKNPLVGKTLKYLQNKIGVVKLINAYYIGYNDFTRAHLFDEDINSTVLKFKINDIKTCSHLSESDEGIQFELGVNKRNQIISVRKADRYIRFFVKPNREHLAFLVFKGKIKRYSNLIVYSVGKANIIK